MAAPTSDLNALAASVYFPPRPNYYPSPTDGCVLMPEAPPFPFNSAGTLYMCPPTLTFIPPSNRYSSYQQSNRRNENGNNINSNIDTTINSSSTPSKDSNDTSIDENQQDLSLLTENLQPCSIADAPLPLVTNYNQRERSTSTESLTSSKYDEQQSTTEEEKQEKNSVPNVNSN